MNPFKKSSVRDNPFTEYIKQAIREIKDIKSAQALAARALITYATSSASTFDHSVTVSSANKKIEVEFTFDNGGYQIINMDSFFRINNSNVMANPVPNVAVTADVLIAESKHQHEEGRQVWTIGIISNAAGTDTAYLKFYFYGTDTGSFTVTNL